MTFLAVAVALSVVALHILHPRVFPDIKGVYSVVTGSHVHTAAVVNAAAGDDDDVRIGADVEIIVYDLLKPRLAQNDGNVYAFVFRARLDENIDTRLSVRLAHDFDIRSRSSPRGFAVVADIVGPFGDAVQIRYF